jgi:periplasmic divalent cation tolerance protein
MTGLAEVEFVQVTTTTDSASAANALAASAVEARLAASAQVIGPIYSYYWWEGAVEEAEEYQLVLKTAADRYPALERHLREEHGYDEPEIVCTAVLGGTSGYLDWVRAETRPS